MRPPGKYGKLDIVGEAMPNNRLHSVKSERLNIMCAPRLAVATVATDPATCDHTDTAARVGVWFVWQCLGCGRIDWSDSRHLVTGQPRIAFARHSVTLVPGGAS